MGVLGGAGPRTRDFGLAIVGEPSGPGGSILKGQPVPKGFSRHEVDTAFRRVYGHENVDPRWEDIVTRYDA